MLKIDKKTAMELRILLLIGTMLFLMESKNVVSLKFPKDPIYSLEMIVSSSVMLTIASCSAKRKSFR